MIDCTCSAIKINISFKHKTLTYIFHMVDIVQDGYFLQKLSLFFNFSGCFRVLLALSHLPQLIFLVNHVRGSQ